MIKDQLALSFLEFRLLVIIHKKKALTGRDIAAVYKKKMKRKVSYGSLYTSLRRLTADGFVSNTRPAKNSKDSRIRVFSLTKTGRVIVRQTRNHFTSLAKFKV